MSCKKFDPIFPLNLGLMKRRPISRSFSSRNCVYFVLFRRILYAHAHTILLWLQMNWSCSTCCGAEVSTWMKSRRFLFIKSSEWTFWDWKAWKMHCNNEIKRDKKREKMLQQHFCHHYNYDASRTYGRVSKWSDFLFWSERIFCSFACIN